MPSNDQQERDTFFDVVGDFDGVPADEFSSGFAEYPAWQWIHGNWKMKEVGGIGYTGGWFLAEDKAPEIPNMPLWTLTTKEGKDIPGFAMPALPVAIVSYRKAWCVGSQEEFKRFSWYDYDLAKSAAAKISERPRGHIQVLVALQSQEEAGPFVLSLRGMASKAMSGKEPPGIIEKVDALLASPLTQLAKKSKKDPKYPRIPLRSFWVLIGYPRVQDQAKTPQFIKVGSGKNTSMITPPEAWKLPDKAVADWPTIAPYYVGKANLYRFSHWYEEAEDWRHGWEAATTDNAEKSAPDSSGYNQEPSPDEYAWEAQQNGAVDADKDDIPNGDKDDIPF